MENSKSPFRLAVEANCFGDTEASDIADCIKACMQKKNGDILLDVLSVALSDVLSVGVHKHSRLAVIVASMLIGAFDAGIESAIGEHGDHNDDEWLKASYDWPLGENEFSYK